MFRKLSDRRSGESNEPVLHDGVPPWLRPSLTTWAEEELRTYHDGTNRSIAKIVQGLERNLRTVFDWGYSPSGALQSVFDRAINDPDLLLDLVDFLLSMRELWDDESAKRLDAYLTQGGSSWTIGTADGHRQLEKRVDEISSARLDRVVSSATRAGEFLARAWSKAYRRDPDPGGAYSDAIKAVETAAIPVVSPKHAKATLGTVIGDLRSTPRKWHFVLGTRLPGDDIETIVWMLESLWKSQHDRHGSADSQAPMSASQAEAEAAVHLAITLVHWFSSGAISVRTSARV